MEQNAVQKIHEVIESEYGTVRGIIVQQNGRVAYEDYFGGYDADRKAYVASVTKSILSALVGIAVDKGYIHSVRDKVLDFFPDYQPILENDIRGQVTLEHLLTMTAPFAMAGMHEPFEVLCSSPDWPVFVLEMMGADGPSATKLGEFSYSTCGAHLVSAILTRAVGMSAREFLNQQLYQPLGLEPIPDYPMEGYYFDDLFGSKVRGWVHDPQGINTGGWGLTMSATEMVRIGQLYLNRGRWGDEQIISADWIEKTTADNPFHYGYLWWQMEMSGMKAFAAMGDGGNLIGCIPELELVVAIASEFSMDAKDRWQLIMEHILPVIKAGM